MAVHKDNEALLDMLDEGLRIVRATGRYEEIHDKWLGIYQTQSFWQEFRNYVWILYVTAIIIALIVAWSFTLRRTVNIRTKELYSEKELLKVTLYSIGDGVITTDKNGCVVLMNKVAEELTGWRQKEAIGLHFEKVFEITNDKSGQAILNPIDEVLKTGLILTLQNHTILIAKNGTKLPIADSAAPIKDKNGDVQGAVLVFRDITQEKQKQEEILYLSFHDQLTGLYNRSFFEAELKRLDTERNMPLSIVMADVNGLKLTNDAFGHVVGDKLLQKTADILKNTIRADDIVARLGGDEFVILLPKTMPMEAEEIVKRLTTLTSITKIESGYLSLSFGWAAKSESSEQIEDILKKAENDMYRHKLYESPSMRAKTIDIIIKTLHEKNKREEQHSNRVSSLCKDMGIALNMSGRDINEIKTAGLMHDIGKIAINEDILNKKDKLSEIEWIEIKRHPEIGYRILSSANDMAELAEYILAHHENWDGTGYPKGLKGQEIPVQSRIIAIIDAYDAMTSERPYRRALSEDTAINEIKNNAGTQFDPQIARIFVEKVLSKSW